MMFMIEDGNIPLSFVLIALRNLQKSSIHYVSIMGEDFFSWPGPAKYPRWIRKGAVDNFEYLLGDLKS